MTASLTKPSFPPSGDALLEDQQVPLLIVLLARVLCDPVETPGGQDLELREGAALVVDQVEQGEEDLGPEPVAPEGCGRGLGVGGHQLVMVELAHGPLGPGGSVCGTQVWLGGVLGQVYVIARDLVAENDAVIESGDTEAVGAPSHARLVALGPRQRTALISWAAFTLTFAGSRAVTYAIKEGIFPGGNAHSRGVHLHHYLWGIKLLAASGGVAVHGSDRLRAMPVVAAGYGAGAALVIDEFALLVHLKDVYWGKLGRVSVLVGGGLIIAVGASFTFIPAWQRRNPPTTGADSQQDG